MAELSNYETMPVRPKPTGPYSASATKPVSATNTTCTWTTYLACHNEQTCADLYATIAQLQGKHEGRGLFEALQIVCPYSIEELV